MYRMTMKTTFDLPESLIRDVKRIAKQRGTTARDIVQQALTKVVEEDTELKPFTLKKMSVPGGLSPEASKYTMHELILMSYDRNPS
jgi:metal-responsive CopG/Arc/MetJ family transcriptional regulator